MKKVIYTFIVSGLLLNIIFFIILFFTGFIKYYNQGNTLYLSGNIDQAILNYSGALEISSNSFEALHNIGNSHYKLGNLDQAIASYESALEIKQDPETQKNLEFVQNKIKKMQQEQSQEQGEEKSDILESKQNGSSQESNNQNSDEQDNSEREGLSQQTQEALEQRTQELEKQQAELKKHYNKNYQPSNSQNLFDKIFNNSLLENSDEKDW